MAEIQLAATAPQDEFLSTRNEDIAAGAAAYSFFTPGYLQYGAFSTTVEELDFPLGLDFGSTSASVVLPVKGTLLGETYLQVDLPALGVQGRWVDAVGYALLQSVMLSVDGVVLHHHSYKYTNIRDMLLLPMGKRKAIDEMIGRGRVLRLDEPHSLFIPFDWFFTRTDRIINPKLPIAAMQSSTVTLTLDIASLASLVVLDDVSTTLPTASLVDPVLLLTYYNVTQREASAFSNTTILIEQVQATQASNYTIDGTTMTQDVQAQLTIPLPFSLPTKHIVWAAQDEYDMVGFDLVDCIANVSLMFNSVTRFECKKSSYFSGVQCYGHATSIPSSNVGFYSFAVSANLLQPSGTCSFGSITGPALKVGFAPSADNTFEPVVVNVYAVTYNQLVVQGGKATVKYT